MPRKKSVSSGAKTVPTDDGASSNSQSEKLAENFQQKLIAPLYVVGIGASAGGLDAIERFFREMPVDSSMAFVVVQHLSPDYKSLMVEIISKYTAMPVVPAADGVEVQANHVYMMQPKRNLVIVNGRLAHREKDPGVLLNFPVDIFLSSLAEDQGDRSIAIILSGTGRDGVEGVQAIKRVGGLVFAQEESTAQFNGMPKNVIATGCVDYVLSPEQMPVSLLEHRGNLKRIPEQVVPEVEDKALARILRLLNRRVGVDYQRYKPATVLRRTDRRMSARGCSSLSDYYEVLENDPNEAGLLHQELLIGVTRFFRDAEAFALLSEKTIPAVLRQVPAGETVRVWICGCSTGEEAYSIAMLFLEQMERGHDDRDLRIFATDIDHDSISFASNGLYSHSIESDITPTRLERFFTKRPEGYAVGRALRRTVTFATHDVIKDPPFTKLNLISCRNLLIYLDASAQGHCLSLFSFALVVEGWLFLGPSETIGGLASQFQSVGGKWKIYRGMAGRQRQVLANLLPGSNLKVAPIPVEGAWRPSTRRQDSQTDFVSRLENRLVKRFAPAGMVVGDNMNVIYTFGDVRRFLHVPEGPVTPEVTKLLPKAMQTVLWAGLLRSWRTGKPLRCATPGPGRSGTDETQTIMIEPFADTERGGNYAFVYFETPAAGMKRKNTAAAATEKENAREQIEDLQRSLQHAQENLQATVEELETSNEELQATNEELLASNEELQSTNEELHSMNEELHSVNAQYQEKIQELTDLHNDISNLFEISGVGAVFLDRELRVRKFTPRAADYIYLVEHDIGRPIEHLSNRLHYSDLMADLRRVISGEPEVQRHVVARDGRSIIVRVVPFINDHQKSEGCVLSLTDVSSQRRAEQRLQVIVDSLTFPLAVLDSTGNILMRNSIWKTWHRSRSDDFLTCPDSESNYFAFLDSSSLSKADSAALKAGLNAVAENMESSYAQQIQTSSHRHYLVTAMPVLSPPKGVVLTLIDLTSSLTVPEAGQDPISAVAKAQ